MTNALPKISCLIVTLDRLILLKEAIRYYCDQTYPNRELVIVTTGDRRYQRAISSHIATLDDSRIKTVFLDGDGYTLGQVRNIALDTASGDMICQWDDDDHYHPQRLWVQAEQMLRAQAVASFMTDYLQFFHAERTLFWIDWSQDSPANEKWHLIPNTLMMFKDDRFRYHEDLNTGEDSRLLDDLWAAHAQIARLRGAGYLYVYQYHGRNTLSKSHHQRITTYCCKEAFFQQHQLALRMALPYYRLPMPYQMLDGHGQRLLVYNG